MFCLDTNIIVFAIRNRPSLQKKLIFERISQMNPKDPFFAEITRAELLTGIHKKPQSENESRKLDNFLSPYQSLPFRKSEAEHYAEIRVTLEENGSLIDPNDLFIAATARASNTTLITNNTREFSRVPGLKIADWSAR